jgi:hypothetical protein
MAKLATFLLFASASANIIFHHVPLTCDPEDPYSPDYTGCLRGQICTEFGTYVATIEFLDTAC